MPISAAARFRYTMVAGTTAVVIGAAFTVAGLSHGSTETPAPTSVDVPLAAAASPGGGDGELLPSTGASATAAPGASASAAAAAAASASARASASAAVKASASASAGTSAGPQAKAAKASPSTRKRTKRPAASPSPVRTNPPAATDATVAEQVLAHINDARVAEGLKALSLDTNLSKAAGLHTQLMIDGCGLSHQCSGEAGLGDRFSAQDVSWGSAGENIGYGSSGSSDAAMVKAANGLTDSMLAEVPPNDGHRKNLLNSSFTRIGLSIVRDAKGITWMTQDFVG